MINKLNNGAQENRKRFTATGRCIYQSALSIDNMLPCFFLEGKGRMALRSKPVFDDVITFGGMEQVQLFSLAESLGGVESLINHPASMTHASVPADRKKALGLTDGLIRLSCGVEDVDDLIADLTQAFDGV